MKYKRKMRFSFYFRDAVTSVKPKLEKKLRKYKVFGKINKLSCGIDGSL